MSDGLTIDIRNVKGAQDRLAQLAVDWGVDAKFLCVDQMRLWLIDLVKKTGGDPKLSMGKQKKVQKEGSIPADLNRVFITNEGEIQEEWDIPGARMLKFNTGHKVAIAHEYYHPRGSITASNAFANSFRDREGRIPKRNYKRKLNGITYIDKRYVKPGYKKILKHKVDRIGRLKAGWYPALQKTAMLSKGGTGRIPRWVSGKSGESRYIDNMTKTASGKLVAQNTVPYASARIDDGLIAATGKTRSFDLLKQANRRRDRIVKQYNGES